MGKGRLEAFSDGVIAVIITIMVLELKAPHGTDLAALAPVAPALLTYVLSFVYVGIYWNNHHHMLHAAQHIDGRVLWANLHLLFWLSLVPFTTGWVGEYPRAAVPTAVYGGVFLMAGVAWLLLQDALVRRNGQDSLLARAVGRDLKGKLSALRSEEHTSELQSQSNLVCRLLLEKKKKNVTYTHSSTVYYTCVV